MVKQSYFEGWGYSDTIKLLIKGTEVNRNLFFKELQNSFPKDEVKKVGKNSIEAFVEESKLPVVKKMATIFKMKIAYKGGGQTDDISIAKTILEQLGGQRRLVLMTGAYNFVAIKNGVTFKIKNRKVNYIKIVLNGNDLYDVFFSKIYGGNVKVISEHNDLYFDQLIPMFEKETGMYLKLFKKGGFVSSQNRDMVLSQLKAIHHHEIELRDSVKTSKDIEAWVLAKVQRATTDLSDVTHYLDGKTEYKTGGTLNDDQMLNELLFKGGGSTPEFIDLFEDYENIPSNIQKILDKYSEDFEYGNYNGLKKALKECESKGYTFEFYLDGEAYALRPKNIPLSKVKGYIEFARGGGLSLADANPYIAGAKAVQGIAPESVSALDRKMASRINPDPNRPVFFSIGGKVGDYVQFRGYEDEVRTGTISEELGNDKYSVSSGFGQVLVDSSNYIGKAEKPAERKRILGIFKEGGEIYKHKHSPNWGEDIKIELIEPTKKGWKVTQTTMKGRSKKTKIAYFSESEIQELFVKI